MTRRAALVLALLIAAFPVLAQEIPVPERRSVAVGDMDFHGGDIRSIFDTEIGFCERACLAEARCRAFTFNSRNGSCFLKTDVTEMQPYQGAISALVLDLGEEAQARGIARARDLAFLPEGYLAAARRQAEGLGLAYPVAAANLAAITRPQADARSGGRNEETLVRLAAETSRTDRSTAWAAYGRMARSLSRGDVVVPGAINAYLRSGDPEEQAAALRLLADGLEAEGQGRLSILALRLAASLAPDPEAEAALERAVSLFGFRIVEHSVESDALEPRICLTFSESLAEAGVDYATYLRLPGPTLAVEAEGEALCITGVKHGQQYAFTFREGLPAANGETLARSVDLDLYVRDRSPSVRFTGRAYVLPKSAGTSIPVVTVNTETVEIRIHRIGDRNLLPAIQDGIFGASLSEWDETRIADRLGEAVWTGTAETERRVNEDVVTALPVGEAVTSFKPGAYAMTARVPGRGEYWENAATQWFVVTDLGLATLSGADGLHVFVRALSSALAREGVRLRLLAANNEVLGEAVTDAEGYARFAPGLARGTGGMAPALVAAADGEGDFAFLSLADPAFDLSDRGVEGREAPPPVDLFLSTERGAYRPGETVHATILARDSRVEAIAGLTLTAVVSRPDGVEHARIVLADQGAGGRALALPLGASAQRGTWRLRIHADPKAAALASASFLVEDFVPERIDFTLALPEGPVPFDAVPEVVVAARYLYGAPGAGLAIEGETAVRAARELEGFPGYLFGLEAEDFPPRFESLAAGSFTDEAGAANVAMALPELPAVTRPLTVTAHLRLAEGSGRPVERTITRPLAPQGVLIGIRPLFDGVLEEGALARFEVIAVGRDLSRTALPRAGWTLSRIETLWQWYQLDGEWYYEPVTRRERVATGMVEIAADAVARIEAPVRWGRYELKLGTLEGERAAASLEFGAGWYAPAAGSDTPDTLSVGLDKAAYRAGETARLRLAPRDAGQVLVRVVGDRLIAMRAVAVEAGESFVDLPVTEDWGPGAYVTATLIRPMDAPAGRNPSRAIGIAWAGIDPDERRLSASFQTPDAVDPRGPLEAVVQIEWLAPGEEAWATIAAVDVGILNLTGFAAPDPAGHYFGQRKLGMEIRDLYGRLIDGLQGDPGRLRSGGDGDLARLQSAPPTEELVAFFAGPVRAEADGTVRARFDLPDFNGTVRLMAVAWTATAVGQAQKDILVRDPVVVTASMPRFLAPGDESRILVELAHATGPSGAVRVEIAAGEGLSLPADAAVADVTLAALGRASLSLPVRAETVGDPALTMTITTPEGRRLVKTEHLPVRANDPEIARTTRLALKPGGGLVLDENAFEGIAPGTGRASLALGPLARFDAAGLLAALDAYPYGCTEQLTSRALPLLYLDEVAEAMGLASRDGVQERVTRAIADVLANQSGSGSFGLWSAEEGELWLDAYVTDFLSRARATGQAVPETAFRLALGNLRNRVNNAGDFEKGGEDIAYALMVLAREGAATIGDLRYYADAKAEALATPLAKAQLGLALAYYGDQERADAMFRLADAALRGAGAEEKLWRVDYGSDARDAAALLALAAEAGTAVVDRGALTRLAAPAGGDLRLRSTQENMWALLAAHALVGEMQAGAITLDGAPMGGPLVRLLEQGAGTSLTLRNEGTQEVEAALTTFGVPNQPEPAGGDGYRIERAYFTLGGEPADLAAVQRSARLVAVVTVTPERDREARLIVNDPLPAGFEIDNPNLVRAGDLAGLDWLDAEEVSRHVEFRSDRFVAAVDWRGEQAFKLAYIVRAVSPGRFRHPAASVEDMYRPEFRARTAAGEVRVAE